MNTIRVGIRKYGDLEVLTCSRCGDIGMITYDPATATPEQVAEVETLLGTHLTETHDCVVVIDLPNGDPT